MTNIIFSHGKESGPQGSKILAMSKVAESLGFTCQSIDYRGLEDPMSRVAKCKSLVSRLKDAQILVGSSMGGYVSTAVASELEVRSLFVLAPAFGMSGYPALITPTCPIEIIHGWRDEVVPVENSIHFAQEASATLHLIDGDHRLTTQIDSICSIFRLFLENYALS
jgi:pimeloyl-ACP methyl ester carboxylesterase